MSEPEGFLARWARRKREAGEKGPAPETREQAAPPDTTATQAEPSGARAPLAPPAPQAPDVDLSALPPIESITATTDIRPFLAPGVPAELTRAALRRAWVTDPQIRDFIGIAENQWDFTDPNAIPGFGPIGPLDDAARLLARVIGDQAMGNDADTTATGMSAPAPEPKSSPVAPPDERLVTNEGPGVSATSGEPATTEKNDALSAGRVAANPCGEAEQPDAAMQKSDAAAPDSTTVPRRGHGSALPR